MYKEQGMIKVRFAASMYVLLFAVFFVTPAPASAQDIAAPHEETTVEAQIPDNLLSVDNDKIVTLAVENDSLGGGSDRHFTSGVRATYLDLGAEFPDIAYRIADLIPTFRINRTSSIIYSLGQNLYTPEDITSRAPDPDDRPWAAYLYGSIGMASLTDNHIDEIEASLGVVGPWAQGEETQSFVHSLLPSPEPKGWDNQLKNEPGITLSWQRRWLEPVSFQMDDAFFTLDPYAGLTLGNVYTYANSGFTFRLGSKSARWQDVPLRVRPAMPGTGFFSTPPRGWDVYLFGGIEGRAVARNIFLDGNTFRDSPQVDKKPFVADANLGVGVTVGAVRVSYTIILRSEEFKGQDRTDMFGALSLGLRF